MMPDFLSVTLSGHSPSVSAGETASLKWQWLDEGILLLTPHGSYAQSVVLSAGIHGNETAPIEVLNQLVSDLLAEKLSLAVRLLVILGNPCNQSRRALSHCGYQPYVWSTLSELSIE